MPDNNSRVWDREILKEFSNIKAYISKCEEKHKERERDVAELKELQRDTNMAVNSIKTLLLRLSLGFVFSLAAATIAWAFLR